MFNNENALETEKTPSENIKDLEGLTKYANGCRVSDLDVLNLLYEGQFNGAKLYTLITDPLYLSFVLRFFSIGLLGRMSELIEEQKKEASMN